MTNPFYPAARIQWYEGMLLLPQHFQHADQRVDDLLALHQAQSVSHYWGVIDCQIDDARVANGQLAITSLRLMMPDGTPFVMMNEDLERFSIDLNDHYHADSINGNIIIYAALAKYIAGYTTVNNDLPRFIAGQIAPQCDENTGIMGEYCAVLKPNVMLISSPQLLARCIYFPLLKFTKQDGVFSLIKEFCPPLLKLSTSNILNRQSQILLKKIRSKINFLIKRMTDQNDDDLSSNAARTIDCLSGGLLSFEAVLQAGVSHPFQVYLSLCHLANNVASLQNSRSLPAFKTYDHNDLWQTFGQIFNYIDNHLDSIHENYALIHFDLQERFFKLPLQIEWQCPQIMILARAQKNMSIHKLIEWIENAVIASDSIVASVRDKRILGAGRKIVMADSHDAFLTNKDSVLFNIECKNEFIKFDEQLNIFNIADDNVNRPQELIFYKVKCA